MKKLKTYLVDKYIYWCDYSLQEAYDNYQNFCLGESGFHITPSPEFPKKLSKKDLSKKFTTIDEEQTSIKEMANNYNQVGLLYCDIV